MIAALKYKSSRVLRCAMLALGLAATTHSVMAGDLASSFDFHWASNAEIGAVTWTGLIVNPDFGYEELTVNNGSRRSTKDPSGFRAGAEVGYDKQIGALVIGVTADISKSFINSNLGGIGTDLQYFGTVRGRLGYSFGRFLAFGTAGLSYGKFSFSNNATFLTEAKTLTGFAAGGGVEYALNKSMTIRVEYTHLDFGDATFGSLPVGSQRVSPEIDLFGVGFVTRF